MSENSVLNRQIVVNTVRQWGGSCTDAVLDPNCKIFSIQGCEGFIGYRLEYRCAVVLGDPVCPPEGLSTLASAFHEFCRLRGYEYIYMSASEEFTRWALKNGCHSAIEYGKELSVNPQISPRSRTGERASLVRRKVRHAQKEGVEVQEYVTHDEVVQEAMESVGDAWLKILVGGLRYIFPMCVLLRTLSVSAGFTLRKERKSLGSLFSTNYKDMMGG